MLYLINKTAASAGSFKTTVQYNVPVACEFDLIKTSECYIYSLNMTSFFSFRLTVQAVDAARPEEDSCLKCLIPAALDLTINENFSSFEREKKGLY